MSSYLPGLWNIIITELAVFGLYNVSTPALLSWKHNFNSLISAKVFRQDKEGII